MPDILSLKKAVDRKKLHITLPTGRNWQCSLAGLQGAPRSYPRTQNCWISTCQKLESTVI